MMMRIDVLSLQCYARIVTLCRCGLDCIQMMHALVPYRTGIPETRRLNDI